MPPPDIPSPPTHHDLERIIRQRGKKKAAAQRWFSDG
jgi:hypothetical protein